jgi:isoleucyl-tRNA synthetase
MSEVNYKDSVFLPKTDFSMKAGLPESEPKILEYWEEINLYKEIRKKSKGKEKFILHDGPPYANGHAHIGHALNKILKDFVIRSQTMMGKDVPYVPGWDCHGLPIEWKIEEKYRAAGKNKDEVDVVEFRKECRDFAAGWMEIQKQEFKRLGGVGDWNNPYYTMAFESEALIAAELGKFILNGSLYKGARPVMWSIVEKTALAEAEVEYHDHTSNTIWVKFKVAKPSDKKLENASIVIWTTTPWTIPANRAIACGKDMDYNVVLIKKTHDDALVKPQEKIVVCADLLKNTLEAAKIEDFEILATIKGSKIEGTVCKHPWSAKGYDYDVPVYNAEFVATDTGTGFVHIAPSHGEDDWALGLEKGLPVPDMVDDSGNYLPSVPLWAGKNVFKTEPEIIQSLKDEKALLANGKIVHSYPHSWRSKAPLIFRTTPQWFIAVDTSGLRKKALEEINKVEWFPKTGRNRIYSMVEGRPDWCVSRQRAWGVPITVFINKKNREILKDSEVIKRIVQIFKEEGADAWFNSKPQRFLGEKYKEDDFEQVKDILDVWFDSGSTHAFVCEQREELRSPADLYLEGSDQHRGWFQSSLLESCGTRGVAPFKQVVTHGFILDEKGLKMSKSSGNGLAPADICKTLGADILRLWVAGSDFFSDLKIGHEILKQNVDSYRRLRNTLRYLIGNLKDFQESERIEIEKMPELERFILHKLFKLDKKIRSAYSEYRLHNVFAEIHNFCTVDLSAFYYDIRKDCLYCDDVQSVNRRSCRTVLDNLFNCLITWLAPIICFTAEEAWQARFGKSNGSVHMAEFPAIPNEWENDDLENKWEDIKALRKVVTGALELKRAEKVIGSSLEAAPKVYMGAKYIAACENLKLEDICITSNITMIEANDIPPEAFKLDEVKGVGVIFEKAVGEKCERCWKISQDVGSFGYNGLCKRCSEVIKNNY